MTTSGHSRMVKTGTPGPQNPPSPGAAQRELQGKAPPKGDLVTVPSSSPSPVLFPAPHPIPSPASPAWKSIPTAREVPDTGTRASDLSLGSRGMPRIPSCTEYRRKEPTPATQVQGQSDTSQNPQAVPQPWKTETGEEHEPGRVPQPLAQPIPGSCPVPGGTNKALSHHPPPPRRAGKGSVAHLGQGSTCYSAPALTQMVQSSANPPQKHPEHFAHKQPLRGPGSARGDGGNTVGTGDLQRSVPGLAPREPNLLPQ